MENIAILDGDAT
jgi:solute carrier family 39 (zinc transporter), member 1/2/3